LDLFNDPSSQYHIDSDSGEVFAVQAVGTGKDNADKGAYKAYTGASKYVLMKTFLLATGDDPEDDGVPAPEPTPEKKPAVKSMKQALEEDDI
jgi:hypothetical protein